MIFFLDLLVLLILGVTFMWQFPQNLLALLLLALSRKKKYHSYYGFDVWQCSIIPIGSAISLGNFILLPEAGIDIDVIKHEYGHQIQSLYLGPLYLLVVGVPSILRAAYKIFTHKDNAWYYSGYPEKWADRLGGVTR